MATVQELLQKITDMEISLKSMKESLKVLVKTKKEKKEVVPDDQLSEEDLAKRQKKRDLMAMARAAKAAKSSAKNSAENSSNEAEETEIKSKKEKSKKKEKVPDDQLSEEDLAKRQKKRDNLALARAAKAAKASPNNSAENSNEDEE